MYVILCHGCGTITSVMRGEALLSFIDEHGRHGAVSAAPTETLLIEFMAGREKGVTEVESQPE